MLIRTVSWSYINSWSYIHQHQL